jgi:hypothetical protein
MLAGPAGHMEIKSSLALRWQKQRNALENWQRALWKQATNDIKHNIFWT